MHMLAILKAKTRHKIINSLNVYIANLHNLSVHLSKARITSNTTFSSAFSGE